MKFNKKLVSFIWLIVCIISVDGAMVQKKTAAKVSQSGVVLVDRTPERVVMMTHGFSNVEMQRLQPSAFEPVTEDRDFFVSNDIVRSKRQAEEFDAENNPTGRNMQDIFGELWQAILESGKKLVKTAATAMDRAANEAHVKQ